MLQYQLGQPLGDIQTDLQKIFALLPGTSGAQVSAKFNELIAFIRSEAERGALQAVPQIKLEVKNQVTPYVVGAIVVGGIGFLFGLAALIRSR